MGTITTPRSPASLVTSSFGGPKASSFESRSVSCPIAAETGSAWTSPSTTM